MKRIFGGRLLLLVLILTLIGLAGGSAAAEEPAPAKAAAPATESAPAEAEALRQQARELWKAGQQEPALARLDQAIARFSEDAENYEQRGEMLSELKRYDAAISDLRRATELKPDFESAWSNLGWYLILQGDFPAAQAASAKAQTLNPDSYASTVNLGHTYLLQGDRETAHAWYRKTIPLLPDEAALKSGPLADFDLFIERGWQVEASREERAWVARAYADWQRARSLNHQALAHNREGRYTEAMPLAEESLALARTVLGGFHPKVAASLSNLAGLLYATGRYGEAEPLAREALAIRRKALPAGHPDIARSLSNLAGLLVATGRTGEAEPLAREALAIRRKALPAGHPDIAQSLNNLAALLHATDRTGEAEPLYREALAIHEKTHGREHPDVATDLNNLAALLWVTDRYGEAEPLSREALAIYRKALPAGHPDIAQSLNNLAGLLETTGRSGEAGPLYHEALAIAGNAGAPKILWLVQGNLSKIYADQAQRPLAIFFGKQAVNTLQAVRRNLQSTEQATQQAFLKSNESYYKGLADLLIAEGRLPEAQQVLDMLKEQEYFDFVRRDVAADLRHTQATLNPFEAEQLARYEAGSRDLARLGAEYQALIQREERAPLTPEEQARLAALRPQLDAATVTFNQAVDAIIAAFQNLSAERRAELTQRQNDLQSDDRGLVRDLGPQVALLHTVMLDERLHLLLTLPQVLLVRTVPVQAVDLNREIQTLRAALQDPRRDPQTAAQALYRHLIAPIAADLDAASIKTLMVSLDGALRYVPLAALHDGDRYLMERYALSVYTAAARDKIGKPPKPAWTVAGFGVSRQHPGFPPLASVPGELAAIIRAAPGEPGVLDGQRQLDQDFTETRLRDGLRRPVVHIASHFSLQPGNETQSFLLLGDGQHLPLDQIRARYDFGSVDLLALSACQTAVGGQNAQGKEIEGLGTLAQMKGAKGVIATLWPVADTSTGLFMQHFYRLRQAQHLSKAEALRQAQLALLRGADRPAEPAPKPASDPNRGLTVQSAPPGAAPPAAFTPPPGAPYAHPYYWAPFILMGNWL